MQTHARHKPALSVVHIVSIKHGFSAPCFQLVFILVDQLPCAVLGHNGVCLLYKAPIVSFFRHSAILLRISAAWLTASSLKRKPNLFASRTRSRIIRRNTRGLNSSRSVAYLSKSRRDTLSVSSRAAWKSVA